MTKKTDIPIGTQLRDLLRASLGENHADGLAWERVLIRLWLFLTTCPDLMATEARHVLAARRAHQNRVAAYLKQLIEFDPSDEFQWGGDYPGAFLEAIGEVLYQQNMGRQVRAVKIEGCNWWLIPRSSQSIHGAGQDVLRFMPHWRAVAKTPVAPDGHCGYHVTVCAVDAANWRELDQPVLTVWLAELPVSVDHKLLQGGTNWVANGLHNLDAVTGAAITALADAAADKVHVLVFPELTIFPETLSAIQKWLACTQHSFRLVIAGSFHEPIRTVKGWNARNICSVLNGAGEIVMRHRKVIPYFSERKAEAEALLPGNTLPLLQTPIGTMSVLICRDLCDESASRQILVPWLPTDWLWVPSMDDNVSRHRARAGYWSREHATCIGVANQSTVFGLSFLYSRHLQTDNGPTAANRPISIPI